MTEKKDRSPTRSESLTEQWVVTENLPGKERHYVVLFFLVVTLLLTWPLLVRPDRVYLTAPAEYFYYQDDTEWGPHWFLGHETLGREWVDHSGHMRFLEEASVSLQNLEVPTLVPPEYTVPPTYTLLGAVVTTVLPVSTIAFHNLFFVGSMFLAGVFTFLLVRELVDDPEVALLSGVLYMSSFYLFYAYLLGHTNQWQIQWIPLILYGLERVRTDANISSISILGFALALQALSSEQYTVYLTFMLPLYVALRYGAGAYEFRQRVFWKGLGFASVLAFVLAGPYIVSRVLLASGGATEIRSIEENMYHWYVIEPTNVAGVFFGFDVPLQFLFRLSLLFLGSVALVTLPRWRQKQILPFTIFFIVGICLSWGPFASWAPYTVVYQFWPFVEYFRAPYRMLPFALLGASVLSSSVLCYLKRDSGWTRTGMAVVALLSMIQVAVVHYHLQFTGYLF